MSAAAPEPETCRVPVGGDAPPSSLESSGILGTTARLSSTVDGRSRSRVSRTASRTAYAGRSVPSHPARPHRRPALRSACAPAGEGAHAAPIPPRFAAAPSPASRARGLCCLGVPHQRAGGGWRASSRPRPVRKLARDVGSAIHLMRCRPAGVGVPTGGCPGGPSARRPWSLLSSKRSEEVRDGDRFLGTNR